MSHITRGLAGLLGTAALLLPCAVTTPAEAARAVGKEFFGTVVDGPLLEEDAPVESELTLMKDSRVGFIRLPFHWNAIQPFPSWDVVPESERAKFVDLQGVPTDVRILDRWVLGAAANGMGVLPVVVRTPWWAAKDRMKEGSPPLGTNAYRRLLRGLVGRYGPRGTAWQGVAPAAVRPIRDWQIWNEPSLDLFWAEDDWSKGYVTLLRAARRTLKSADPGSRIVLAGLPNYSWRALAQIYEAGGRGQFDVAAVHPYTARVKNVVQTVTLVRRTMVDHGDANKRLAVTEMGWTAGQGKAKGSQTWDTTEAVQAKRLSAAFAALTRQRQPLNLANLTWYTWLSKPAGGDVFEYAGLRSLTPEGPVSRPALGAFRASVQRLTR